MLPTSVSDTHELGFGEEVETPAPALPTKTAGFHPAERLTQIAQEVAVDPNHACPDACSEVLVRAPCRSSHA